MEITIKQTPAEQAEIRKQLDRVLLPFKLDWNDVPSMNMLGSYMQKNFVDANGVMDASFANCYAAIKALKAHISWVDKAPRTAAPILEDGYGRQIRNLKQEREDRARANQREERDTIQQQFDRAQKQGITNVQWAACRQFAATANIGESHGQRARAKEALVQVLNQFTGNGGGTPEACMQALKAKARELQNAPRFA